MTKPIIVVKVPCKLLYVIQVKEFLIKCSTSWPYLISEFLVAYITTVASDWPRTFLHPRCFCLAYIYTHIVTILVVICTYIVMLYTIHSMCDYIIISGDDPLYVHM